MARLVDTATSRLRQAGIADPRRESIRLVGDLAGLTPGEVVLRGGEPEPAGLARALTGALERRAAGEPLPYVSGVAGFRGLTLAVDARVLIPRPETEGLVELVLAAEAGGRVVDVGTGSGCIALSLAQEGRYRDVVGIDCSPGALGLAAANGTRLGLRVRWLEGDLLAPVAGETFDVVVSNPPYLTVEEYRALDPSVRSWEPELALASGGDGLEATRRLLQQAGGVLRTGGVLALEVDSSRAALVAALARDSGWSDVAVTRDLFGRDRYCTARRGPKP